MKRSVNKVKDRFKQFVKIALESRKLAGHGDMSGETVSIFIQSHNPLAQSSKPCFSCRCNSTPASEAFYSNYVIYHLLTLLTLGMSFGCHNSIV